MRGLRWRLSVLSCGFVFAACPDPEPGNPKEERGSVPPAEQTRCERGDNAACEQLTDMYLRGIGVERSLEKAAALNKRLCETGRRYFCPTYAFVLAVGSGVPKDRDQARRLFKENCLHDPKACSEYGSLFAAGTGMPQDLELGVELLGLACRYQDAQACQDLGRIEAAVP